MTETQKNVFTNKKNTKLVLDKTLLSELEEYLDDTNVTDIDWDGTDLWVTDVNKGTYKSDIILSNKFIDNFCVKLCNLTSHYFNKNEPVMEAESEDLRISVYHESICSVGTSISIRKTPLFVRLNRETMLEEGYCDEELLCLCENSIKAHMNMFVGGLPGAGKTELLKFLAKDIPENEKIITIEDNRELHLKYIYPAKHVVELKVGKDEDSFDYESALRTILRHHAKWTFLSESRGKEVFHLLNNLSNGTYCCSTIHLNDFRKFPDRIISMMGDVAERYVDNVYQFVDMGVLVEKYLANDGTTKRKITQVMYFTRENGVNKHDIVYENGILYKDAIPKEVKRKFLQYNIDDPFRRYNE